MHSVPAWLDATPWLSLTESADAAAVSRALVSENPGPAELAGLLSPAGAGRLEEMAQRALALTRSRFGRTINLYAPVYLSDYCSSGCAYCGFASDRPGRRRRIERDALALELAELKNRGIEDVLLLTGERTPKADFDYLKGCVAQAAETFPAVSVEAFPMSVDEYRGLADVGCTGVTIYQETYDPVQYEKMHRWGHKRDYAARLDAPARALEAGIRHVGLGVLLGLADPAADAIRLFRHAVHLGKTYWRGGISISFPRICAQSGDFMPPFPVDEAFLARLIFAFRICLPDTPLVLSTRERPSFRDGMAGLGISRMSAASSTSVGGYRDPSPEPGGQFEVNDTRDVTTFCAMLRSKGLEPVFKNWDSAYRDEPRAVVDTK